MWLTSLSVLGKNKININILLGKNKRCPCGVSTAGLRSHVRFPVTPAHHFSACQRVLLPHFALRLPKSWALNLHTPNWSCKKRKCKGKKEQKWHWGGGTERLSRVHHSKTAAFLLITSPCGSGGPLWCLAQVLFGHFQLKLVGSKGLSKGWHGMHSFCFSCWLLFLAESDLSQRKRQSWFFPKYKFLIMPDCYKWEITAASASSSCWNVMMIPSCYTYLVVALYLKIVNTWLFSSKDFGNPGLVGCLSFLSLHTQKIILI